MLVPFKYVGRCALFLGLALSLACSAGLGSESEWPVNTLQSDLNPTSKGPKPTEIQPSGTIAARLDLGLNLSPADFIVLQQNGFNLADIDKAVVTITSAQVASAQAELSRQEIAAGWTFLFKNIPVGQAKVQLKVLNRSGQVLFEQAKDVDVQSGLITPVEFVIDLTNPEQICREGTCSGSVQVTVRALTNCLGILNIPSQVQTRTPLLLKLDALQGHVERFEVDFGDGSPKQSVLSFPVSYTYQQPGRYRIGVKMQGASCKNPLELSQFVTVQ